MPRTLRAARSHNDPVLAIELAMTDTHSRWLSFPVLLQSLKLGQAQPLFPHAARRMDSSPRSGLAPRYQAGVQQHGQSLLVRLSTERELGRDSVMLPLAMCPRPVKGRESHPCPRRPAQRDRSLVSGRINGAG